LGGDFLLPFFLDISVERFGLSRFREFFSDLSQIHFSELSVFEAKAGLCRFSKKNPAYTGALVSFGEKLPAKLTA